MKKYIILAIVILIIGLGISVQVLYKQNVRNKAEIKRLAKNVSELTALNSSSVSLVLKQKEFMIQLSDSLKSVLKRLEIAPKTIVQVVEKTVTLHDTIDKMTLVYPMGGSEWRITDQEKCWKWEGVAKLERDSMTVKRVGFDYQNKTIDIFSKKLKWKFLFIKVYSKDEIVQNSVSDCGQSVSRSIRLVK